VDRDKADQDVRRDRSVVRHTEKGISGLLNSRSSGAEPVPVVRRPSAIVLTSGRSLVQPGTGLVTPGQAG
jgi:molybdopterin biosynthesis enzyme